MKGLLVKFGFALLLSSVMFSACEKELKRVERNTYPNGNPKIVIYYDGEETQEDMAIMELYHQNGQVKTKKRYEDGLQHGLTESWYADGSPWSEANYDEGKKVGDYIHKYQNQVIKQKGHFTDGKKDGEWINFSNKGDTTSIEIWNMGQRKKIKRF
ncbi:MAG: hypothetical protein PF489_00670 [Salinivirgaceae bacterium]|jgi:antitoxin component YwqK of YwqJK toxin-antitoxin module|nr:hypothetical protein [Salinivirgaceae bacterium]